MNTNYVNKPADVRFMPRTYRSQAVKRYIAGKRSAAKAAPHCWKHDVRKA